MMMWGPNERIDPEEPIVMGDHSLGSIVKVCALDTVEDIGVPGAHCSEVLLHGTAELPDCRRKSAKRCGSREVVEIDLIW